MLDRYTIRLFKNPLAFIAGIVQRLGGKPDQVTIVSFLVGLLVLPALYFQNYWLALLFIVLNRIGDGVDGSLARLTEPSDAGGYLDIVLDFIFYSAVVLGFALADTEKNGLAAAVLLFAFVGTGSSFLAFALMAERRGIENIIYPNKGIYYLGGLTEGSETIICFVLFCLFPSFFVVLAFLFAALCFITTLTRVIGGYYSLKRI